MPADVLLALYLSGRLTAIKNSVWRVRLIDLNTSTRTFKIYICTFQITLAFCSTFHQLIKGVLYVFWHNSQLCDCVNIYFTSGLNRCQLCSVWNPRRLFNGRLALTHHRNQARHVFYDLVNEQRCCETCVCVLGGGLVGGGLVSDRDLSSPPPLCLDGGALPREQCWTGRNLCPDFQILPYPLHKSPKRAVSLSQLQLQACDEVITQLNINI